MIGPATDSMSPSNALGRLMVGGEMDLWSNQLLIPKPRARDASHTTSTIRKLFRIVGHLHFPV